MIETRNHHKDHDTNPFYTNTIFMFISTVTDYNTYSFSHIPIYSANKHGIHGYSTTTFYEPHNLWHRPLGHINILRKQPQIVNGVRPAEDAKAHLLYRLETNRFSLSSKTTCIYVKVEGRNHHSPFTSTTLSSQQKEYQSDGSPIKKQLSKAFKRQGVIGSLLWMMRGTHGQTSLQHPANSLGSAPTPPHITGQQHNTLYDTSNTLKIPSLTSTEMHPTLTDSPATLDAHFGGNEKKQTSKTQKLCIHNLKGFAHYI